MRKAADKYILKFLIWASLLFIIAVAAIAFFLNQMVSVFCLSYLISAVFVGTNLLIARKVDIKDNTHFFRIFGWSLAGRFVAVIAAIVLALQLLNIHELFFTVSFLISYICHSVIEIIFINKILETDTE